MTGWLKHFQRNEEGGVLAELAVTIVPFLLMLGLVFEGGRILWTHQIAAKAARDATRSGCGTGQATNSSSGACCMVAIWWSTTLGAVGVMHSGWPSW